jgi:hypothetical protein
MLADAFPERNPQPPLSWRRSGVGVAVLLLHLILLYALLHAVVASIRPKPTAQEITILFPAQPKKQPKEKQPPPPPSSIDQVPRENTAPITIPPLIRKPHSTEDDGIGRLGRYLDNCSAGNYGALSEQEWANCLGGMATRDRNGDTIKLGDVRTLWEKQHPKTVPDPKEAKGFVGCAHDDPKRLMGLPCFQYNGEKPSVANGQQ